ncbi:spondin domain-containing protein [Kaarinaea lacus]
MNSLLKQGLYGLMSCSALLLLAGCSDDDDNDETMMEHPASYEIKVMNITHGQPLTPILVVAHQPDYHLWQVGNTASASLEALAEGGDTAPLLSEVQMDMNVAAVIASSSGPFGPGSMQSVTVETMPNASLQISVASMLANTNDAFTGVTNVAIGQLASGESIATMAHAYDAGTESNSEAAADIPGPAGNGEGFNATRDDVDFISVHAGVVTSDDGLATSALTEDHRWLGPTAKVVITRLN